MNVEVLLVVPRYRQYGGKYIMPLGILYVSAALKQAGFTVASLNLNHVPEENEDNILYELLKDGKIRFAASGGLSGEFSSLYPFFEKIKKINSHITTICGGGIITASGAVAMTALKNVDIGISGEGEETICRLFHALQCGSPLQNIPGLVFRDPSTEEWISTGQAPDIRDLNSLPFPDYDGFGYRQYLQENHNGYGWNGERLSPVSIIGSRSCPYQCSFCFHPTGATYRERTLDSIFKEIDFLNSRYQINALALREELFSVNFQRIAEFSSRIEKYKFYWTIQLRINQVTEEMFRTLAKSHCFAVFLGIESIHPTVLKSMNKKITPEQIEYAMETAEKNHVMIRSGLIFGDSAETLETAEVSLKWLKRHRIYDPILKRPNIIADMLIPFPGSPIYRQAVKRGIIEDEVAYLRMGCPLVNLTEMPDSDYLRLIRKVKEISGDTYTCWSKEKGIFYV